MKSYLFGLIAMIVLLGIADLIAAGYSVYWPPVGANVVLTAVCVTLIGLFALIAALFHREYGKPEVVGLWP